MGKDRRRGGRRMRSASISIQRTRLSRAFRRAVDESAAAASGRGQPRGALNY